MSTPQETPPPSIRFLDATIRAPGAVDAIAALIAGGFLWLVAKVIFGEQPIPLALWASLILGVGSAAFGISVRAAPKAFAAVVGAISVLGAITLAILGALK